MTIVIEYRIVMNMMLASRHQLAQPSLRELKSQIFNHSDFRFTHPDLPRYATYEGITLHDQDVEIKSEADFQKRLEKTSNFQLTFDRGRSLMQRARL